MILLVYIIYGKSTKMQIILEKNMLFSGLGAFPRI